MTDTMNEIHEALASHFLDQLKNSKHELKAADLSVIRQFLKDNDIQGLATEGSPIKGIVENLPFDDEDKFTNQV